MTGKLKGYERDEDLQEICGYKKEKEKKKLDPEKLAKYGSNNVVQVEKMLGEYDGVQRMRKRRLAKEPEGFLLEPSDSTYNCTICHEQTLSGEMWWYPNALWCPECKKNIDNGVIPKLVSEERHEETWLKEFDLEFHYGIKKQTIRKLEKEGILNPRKLVNSGGKTYCSVYLVKENKEFLRTYKKVEKAKPIITYSELDSG